MFSNAKYNTSTNTKIIYYFYIKNNKLLSSKVFYSETKKLKNNLDIPNTSLIKKHYMSNVLRMQKVFIEINTLLKQIRLFPLKLNRSAFLTFACCELRHYPH